MNWDEYYINMLDAVAERATCNRGKSGCIITQNNRIIVNGYVGSPEGLEHCDDAGHLMIEIRHINGEVRKHCARTIHAEANAIGFAAKYGISLNGSTIYVNMTPCPYICAPLIIAAGINKVICRYKYHAGSYSEELFKKANVELIFMNDKTLEYNNQKS